MDEFALTWSYRESIEELRSKYLHTALELETVRMEANEQMRKTQEYVKSLLDLLNTAQKERDEARDQLQRIIAKISPSPNPNPNPIQTQNHHFKANSSITESNSLGSPPVDSFFDSAAVSSPEFSSFHAPPASERGDPAAAAIERLARKRALPEKGRLLQAVMEAGPLLQTLLVAGPLPQWRNPPPVQSFRIPAVAIAGAEGSHACSASMLSFAGGSAIRKRQRLLH